uniref:Secreted protein n=1 Tax=Macrostomum lignano TaxID=282301 RepID=A0A1I8FGJ6_9PLAT
MEAARQDCLSWSRTFACAASALLLRVVQRCADSIVAQAAAAAATTSAPDPSLGLSQCPSRPARRVLSGAYSRQTLLEQQLGQSGTFRA